MNFDLIKKHPLATGAIVIIGAVVVYFAMHGNSSGSAPVGSLGGSLTGADLQLANANAASNLVTAQYGAQVTTAQIGGQVAIAQTNAQLAAVGLETEAAKAIVTTQTQGATDVASINADATTQQTKIQADAATTIAVTGFNDQLQAAQASIAANSAIASKRLDIVNNVITQAGKDKSRSSTGWTQILSGLNGQGPEAIAANQPSAVASSPAGIISGIAKAIPAFASFF